MRGAATSRRIQETMSDSAKRPQYAILADRLLILDTTVLHASHAHAAQHDARQEAAHIFSHNKLSHLKETNHQSLWTNQIHK